MGLASVLDLGLIAMLACEVRSPVDINKRTVTASACDSLAIENFMVIDTANVTGGLTLAGRFFSMLPSD